MQERQQALEQSQTAPACGLTIVSMAPVRYSSRSVPLKKNAGTGQPEKEVWYGVNSRFVGRPAGLIDRGVGNAGSREAEEVSKKVLSDFGDATDDRPRLVRFFPVKESQMISDSAPVNLYSKPSSVQGEDLVYKLYHAEARLVRSVLEQAGFCSTDSHDWNLLWAGTVPQKYLFEGLLEFQKINHFPSSEELTRKDRLYANVCKLQERFGREEFSFLPETFILPEDFSEFAGRFRDCPDQLWIAKPNASSQGKGIFLVESLSDVMISEPYIVSQYITNPLLINSLKFDMRVYVLVTSYDPIRIYVYEEGLARFASEEYVPTGSKKNRFMHLTNYSVNKKNDRFIQNQDYRKDNIGHKWSLSALFHHLESQGIDISSIWTQIYDAVIKSILSIEDQVIEACRELSLCRGNCFDLFGFDVLLDERLKPWVLEVNLSPSLATDSPLDLYVKGNLVADTLNLVGVRAFNRIKEAPNRIKARLRLKRTINNKSQPRMKSKPPDSYRLKDIAKDTAEEYLRRGHFIRIYPSKGCEYYDQFFPMPKPANRQLLELFGMVFGDCERAEQRPKTSLTTSTSAGNIDTRTPQLPQKTVRSRVSTAARVTITGDDIILEYTARLIAVLLRLTDSELQRPWRRAIDHFLLNAVWRSLDDPQEPLWKRVTAKHTEMLERLMHCEKFPDAEKRCNREEAMQGFATEQLEGYLRSATTGVTREVVAALVGKNGVVSEMETVAARKNTHMSAEHSPEADSPELPLDPLPSLRLICPSTVRKILKSNRRY